jgi:hypothetical protein
MSENYDLLRQIAEADVIILEDKGKFYGSSWRKRGGVGAFMMLARKWDRIENQMEAAGYDIFGPVRKEMVASTTDGLLDDIRDLRRYLLLVEGYVMDTVTFPNPGEPHLASAHVGGGVYEAVCPECGKTPEKCQCGEPGPGYVNQDPDVLSPTQPRRA